MYHWSFARWISSYGRIMKNNALTLDFVHFGALLLQLVEFTKIWKMWNRLVKDKIKSVYICLQGIYICVCSIYVYARSYIKIEYNTEYRSAASVNEKLLIVRSVWEKYQYCENKDERKKNKLEEKIRRNSTSGGNYETPILFSRISFKRVEGPTWERGLVKIARLAIIWYIGRGCTL